MLLSLTIELLQIYLPTRDSSMIDLICNTLGTIFGVIIFHYFFAIQYAIHRKTLKELHGEI